MRIIVLLFFLSLRSFSAEIASENPTNHSTTSSNLVRSLPVIESDLKDTKGKGKDKGHCTMRVQDGELKLFIEGKIKNDDDGVIIGGTIPGRLIQPDMKLTDGFSRTVTLANGHLRSTATFKNGVLHIETTETYAPSGGSRQTWDIHLSNGSPKDITEIKYKSEENNPDEKPVRMNVHCGELLS